MFVINKSLGSAGKMDAASLCPLTAAAAAASPSDSVGHPESAKAAVLNGDCWVHQWQTDKSDLHLNSHELVPACSSCRQIRNFKTPDNNINQSPTFNFLLETTQASVGISDSLTALKTDLCEVQSCAIHTAVWAVTEKDLSGG